MSEESLESELKKPNKFSHQKKQEAILQKLKALEIESQERLDKKEGLMITGKDSHA